MTLGKKILQFASLLAVVWAMLPAVSAFLPQTVHGSTATRKAHGQIRGVTLLSKTKEMSTEEYTAAMEKATKQMTAFTNKYLANTCTKLCTDKSVPAVVIKGLAEHKVNLGAPLCPCRFYDDKEKEAKDGYWNCPCVPMRERNECHCMLFLTEDNEFVGDENNISYDEVLEKASGLP